jgi:hypothetical protein
MTLLQTLPIFSTRRKQSLLNQLQTRLSKRITTTNSHILTFKRSSLRELYLGAHVSVRKLNVVTHHHHAIVSFVGATLAECKVIHYVEDSKENCIIIKETLWDEFISGNVIASPRLIHHHSPAYRGRDAVARAKSKIGIRDYDVTDHNCEHFVNWCIDGDSYSGQVRGFFFGATVAGLAVAITGALGSLLFSHGRRF